MRFPDPYAVMAAMESNVLWPQDIFDRYQSVDRIFHLFALAVRPDYRRRGIARNMVEASLQV